MGCRLCGFPTVHPNVWRFIGFVSSLVGLISYAVSSPFNKLFKHGMLGLLGVVIYCAVGSLVCVTMLCTTTWRIPKSTVLIAHIVFTVLMVTSVYSFYLDETEGNTKEKDGDKVLNLVSCEAFALMSLSLSRLTGLGFESGMFNFFLGSLMVAVMKWNLKFALAAAAFCYILVIIRTCSDSQRETDDEEEGTGPIEIRGISSSFNNCGHGLQFRHGASLFGTLAETESFKKTDFADEINRVSIRSGVGFTNTRNTSKSGTES